MGQKNKLPKSAVPSAVVGIVDSPEAWRLAARLRPGSLDALECRADCLPDIAAIPTSRLPWILTVRHPREGGRGGHSSEQRKKLFFRLLAGAAVVDVELRSMRVMRKVFEAAAERKIRRIASFHDFRATPSSAQLRELAFRAEDSGADVFKVATWAAAPRDIVRLLELFSSSPLPLAAMAMGPLGFSSRLLFAACGSAFNYGWLHRPNAPGQWPALELKKMLAR
ncbi:MAG: type I 3-dehydroquinate dehydratase [Verrucomicrobiae bacterium]